jgi:hypothetical protein
MGNSLKLKQMHLTVFLAAALCLTSCEIYRNNALKLAHGGGLVMVNDVHHAWAWEDVLHKKTGYTAQQVKVVEGAGLTRIYIYSVKLGESKKALAQRINEVATIDPEIFGPTVVIIEE